MLQALKKCGPRDSKYKSEKLKLLDNSKTFYDGSKMIVNAFKNKIFLFYINKGLYEDEDKDKDEYGSLDMLYRLIDKKGGN